MTVENSTANRGYQLPDPANLLETDVERLIAALTGIDADVSAILVLIGGKANTAHAHVIADVTGLQASLDARALAGHGHALDDLSDVTTTGAANGYVLKLASGVWTAAGLAIADIATLQATLTSLQSQITNMDGGAY